MSEFSDIANYLLRKSIHNITEICKKPIKGFIYDPKPVTMEDLEPQEKLKEILLDLMIRYRHVVRTDKGKLRFTCEYNRDHSDGFHRCNMNEHGICRTEHTEEDFPWIFLHKYNGRKMWRCPCG